MTGNSPRIIRQGKVKYKIAINYLELEEVEAEFYCTGVSFLTLKNTSTCEIKGRWFQGWGISTAQVDIRSASYPLFMTVGLLGYLIPFALWAITSVLPSTVAEISGDLAKCAYFASYKMKENLSSVNKNHFGAHRVLKRKDPLNNERLFLSHLWWLINNLMCFSCVFCINQHLYIDVEGSVWEVRSHFDNSSC